MMTLLRHGFKVHINKLFKAHNHQLTYYVSKNGCRSHCVCVGGGVEVAHLRLVKKGGVPLLFKGGGRDGGKMGRE